MQSTTGWPARRHASSGPPAAKTGELWRLAASGIDPKNEHSILKFEDETASLVGALWLHDRLAFSLGNFFYDEIASSRISRDEDVHQGCISRLQLNYKLFESGAHRGMSPSALSSCAPARRAPDCRRQHTRSGRGVGRTCMGPRPAASACPERAAVHAPSMCVSGPGGSSARNTHAHAHTT